MGRTRTPSFVISLDFELMWGVRDKRTIATYGKNIVGARAAIPEMLRLFRKYQAKATWATVGLLLFHTKKDLLAHLPERRPSYDRSSLNPFSRDYLDSLGEDERRDPYHYGLSLAQQIVECEGMELASHTFSHYYCLESGQNAEQFRADLNASIEASRRLSARPVSLVFPRNQCNRAYLPICAELGFLAFRGNEASWLYQESPTEKQSVTRRAARLIDTYMNISGDNGFMPSLEMNMINVPSSRFLRPFSNKLQALESLRLNRIRNAMTQAARDGKSFHLWWHPHNFGTNLSRNLIVLEKVLAHSRVLREKYGMTPMTMAEAAAELAKDVTENSLEKLI